MSSVFEMIDVGDKPITKRRAIARGTIQLSPKVCQAIIDKKIPKGDVLTLAEVAGIGAAKKTSDILPLCHPLNIDKIKVLSEIDPDKNQVHISCEVSTHGKTGVEMEALHGTTAALLCIYDLTKGLDKAAAISSIFLDQKEGGKSGMWHHPEYSTKVLHDCPKQLEGLRAAVLTVSDRCSRGESDDVSGEHLAQYLIEQGATLGYRQCVPDEVETIRATIQSCVNEGEPHLILITGGTGIGPRDVTPEALSTMWTKHLPGFGEQFRRYGQLHTPRALISRAEAGLIGNTLTILLPGSPSGVKDGLTVIHELIPHMISMIQGGKH